MNTTFVCLILIFARCCLCYDNDDEKWREFRAWKLKYNKHYGSIPEEVNRFIVWRGNSEYVDEHTNNIHSEYRLEINEFADVFNTFRPRLNFSHEEGVEIEQNFIQLPSSFDWRTKGAITPVINQGMMGDVITIVAKESMESYNFLKSNHLVELSGQEIRDCCTHGSGLMIPVFDCIHKINGLCLSSAYPNNTAGQCRNDSCSPIIKNMGTFYVLKGREDQLQLAVLQSPLMAGIDASHTSFQLYKSGIYNEPDCSSTNIDHVVQIVGYGSQNGNDYWIARNSWGEDWGMKGYILMSRNKNNQCGIASMAMYPV